jgi:hypothetical protein
MVVSKVKNLNKIKKLTIEEEIFLKKFSWWWFLSPILMLFFAKKGWLAVILLVFVFIQPVFFLILFKIFPGLLFWFKIRNIIYLNGDYNNFNEFKSDIIFKEKRNIIISVLVIIIVPALYWIIISLLWLGS